MGACEFRAFVPRKSKPNAAEAFSHARDQAAWEHGHGGYTGTIAEKHGFRMVDVPAGVDPRAYVDDELLGYDTTPEGYLENKVDGFWHDKWGDAGCVEIPGENGGWLFFGWASC